MILKNRRTREILEIEYSEFRKKFAKEIQIAFESFRKTELNKSFYNYKDDNWSLISIFNSNGISIILETQFGTSRECDLTPFKKCSKDAVLN